MTNESWLISIEQTADFVASHLGDDTVQAIYQKYSATCLEDLNSSHYSDVFGELYQYETDLRD